MQPRRIRARWFPILMAIFLTLGMCTSACLMAVGIIYANIKKRPDDLPPSFCKTMDTEPPVISVDGGVTQTILLGETYVEPEVTAIDDCDAIEVNVIGEVNSTKVGEYRILYEAVDDSGNRAELKYKVKVIPEYQGTIYLTFDDGPGPYTARLLDVLKKYDVRATFFVTGRGDDDLILREYNEGHAIGLHSFSHDYSTIYRSVDAFFEDLYAVQDRVKNITGETSMLMRFPGGSSNTVSARYDGRSRIMTKLTSEVEEKGFTYFDWNVSSGDAEGITTADGVYERVVGGLKVGGDSVILQHDIKDFSVDAVERIIQYGLENDYQFERLNAESFTAHHRVNN